MLIFSKMRELKEIGGVYRIELDMGEKGVFVYVGESINIKDRIKRHFNHAFNEDRKGDLYTYMCECIDIDFDIIYESEVLTDRLVKESEFIGIYSDIYDKVINKVTKVYNTSNMYIGEGTKVNQGEKLEVFDMLDGMRYEFSSRSECGRFLGVKHSTVKYYLLKNKLYRDRYRIVKV